MTSKEQKNYEVLVDVIGTIRMNLDASSEEEAEILAEELIHKDPYYYLRNFTFYSCEVANGFTTENE